MANKILWSPETGANLISTDLNNLAADAMAVAPADYTNEVSKWTYASFLFTAAGFAGAPGVGEYLELHLVYQVDGTSYGDGKLGDLATGPVGNGSTLIDVFPLTTVATKQVVQLMNIPIMPFPFRAAIVNKTAVALAASGNILRIQPHVDEVQ